MVAVEMNGRQNGVTGDEWGQNGGIGMNGGRNGVNGNEWETKWQHWNEWGTKWSQWQ